MIEEFRDIDYAWRRIHGIRIRKISNQTSVVSF